jgi:hypothetical protein
VLEVFEDLRRVENLDRIIDHDGNLSLGIDPQHLRMLRLIAPFHVKRHHDQFERDSFLASRDFNLGSEHAQRAGEDSHPLAAVVPIAAVVMLTDLPHPCLTR